MRGENGFIIFPFGNKILIAGKYKKTIVSLNTETKDVEETNLELHEEDDFFYFNNGMKVNNSIYLIGNDNLHIVDIISKEIRIIRYIGIAPGYA